MILRLPPRFKIVAGIGRFHDRKPSRQPLLRRKVVEQYPPFSGEVICSLAGIAGESFDSGHSSGLGAEANLRFCRPIKNDFSGSVGKGSQIREQG